VSTRVPIGWVDLIVATNEPEAHLIAGILQEAGIGSRLDTGRFTIGAGMYGVHNPMSPVAVMVERERLDEARSVLAETDLAVAEKDSEEEQDVDVLAEPQGVTWRTVVKWVAAVVAALFLLSLLADNPLFPWR
jgi:hypothetical protein